MPLATRLTNVCQLLVALSLLTGLLLLTSPFRININIESDLKTLAPILLNDPNVQGAIDKVSSSIERRFTLVLSSRDEDELEEAIDYFFDEFDFSNNSFILVDSNTQIDNLKTLLASHRFSLVSKTRLAKLSSSTDDELLTNAESRLFSLESATQLFSITQDPFGFLSEFIVENNNQSTDIILESTYENRRIYHSPINFIIKGDALSLREQKHIEEQLTQIKHEISKNHSSITFLHSGIIFFATDAAKKSEHDIRSISSLSTFGILLLFLIIFRSIKPLILPLISITFGLAFAFIACQLFFSSVHVITIIFGASLIGVVVDYTLHHYYHHDAENLKKQGRFHSALALSLVTSVIGYAALSFSSLEALQRVALFSVLGLIGAWLMVIAAGPYFKGDTLKRYDAPVSFIIKCLETLLAPIATKKHILFIFVGITLLGVIAIPRLLTSDNPRIFFTPDPQLLKEEMQVARLTSAYEPGNYLIVKGKSPDELYQRINQVITTNGNTSLLSIASFVPSPKMQDQSYRAQQRIYRHGGLYSQFLTDKLISDDAIVENERAYVNAEGVILSPDAFMDAMGSAIPPLWLTQNDSYYSFILIPKNAHIETLKLAAKHSSDIHFIQTSEMAKQSIAAQRISASKLVAIGICLIAALLLIRYRRISMLSLLTIPVSSILLTLSIFSLLSITLTLFHVMALFLIIGLGMDYVIFVSELSEDSASNTTLHAILLSALTSALSFGLLSTSSLPIVSAFGLTVLIGNTCNLLGTILFAKFRLQGRLV
ncbi:MAG: MMPL family transporter [Agarilytica sp.]